MSSQSFLTLVFTSKSSLFVHFGNTPYQLICVFLLEALTCKSSVGKYLANNRSGTQNLEEISPKDY